MISLAAILIFVGTFAVRRDGINQAILIVTIVTLGIVTVVHTRFISFAQGQSRQTTNLLWNKEHEFQSIFENALDAILVLDGEGICRNANPSAANFFSTRSERLVGQPVRALYAEADDFLSVWNKLRADRRCRGEAELVRADGEKVYAEFTAVANFLPNRHLMIFRDITSRRRAHQALNQSLMVARSSWQEAETLRKASLALTKDLRMNSVLDALLEALADFVPYEGAQLFLLENHTRLFLAREAHHGPRPIPQSGFPDVCDIADLPILKRALACPEGIRAEDVSKEANWRLSGKKMHLKAWIGVPIVSSNQVLGLLSLTSSEPGHFSASHLALARSLATPAAVAIQNARLYERVEIYGAELERRVAELQQRDQEVGRTQSGNRAPIQRFEEIFRSAPVAISVSTLVNGKYLETNETFQRSFGLRPEEIASGAASELELWEDPRQRARMIEQLGRGGTVRHAVARFRRTPGTCPDTKYSAQMIEIEGESCILFVTEDHIP